MNIRSVFVGELKKLIENDKNVIVLDADLAKASGTLALRTDFPEQAIDCGVAEQNMASIAAGLASYGFKPYITTFTAFATRRICDQIAISIAYAKQNVKIVGTDPGISAQLNGGTHMSVEDIGVLRSIPDLMIFEPLDGTELKKAMPVIHAHEGPVYIRLFRKELPDVYTDDYKFELFKAHTLQEGSDVSIFVSGGVAMEELTEANKQLKADGINAEIINVHTIKPIDRESIVKSLKNTKCAVTVENHNILGGLYSAVAEVAVNDCPVHINPIGIPDRFGEVGRMPYLKGVMNMRAEDIVEAVKNVIAKK